MIPELESMASANVWVAGGSSTDVYLPPSTFNIRWCKIDSGRSFTQSQRQLPLPSMASVSAGFLSVSMPVMVFGLFRLFVGGRQTLELVIVGHLLF